MINLIIKALIGCPLFLQLLVFSAFRCQLRCKRALSSTLYICSWEIQISVGPLAEFGRWKNDWIEKKKWEIGSLTGVFIWLNAVRTVESNERWKDISMKSASQCYCYCFRLLNVYWCAWFKLLRALSFSSSSSSSNLSSMLLFIFENICVCVSVMCAAEQKGSAFLFDSDRFDGLFILRYNRLINDNIIVSFQMIHTK